MKSLNLTLTLKGFGLRFSHSSFSSKGKFIIIRSINFQDFNQNQNQTRNRCVRVSGGMSNNETKKVEEEQSTEKKVGLDKSLPEPTPPEKPLPGDCCGSGCVRCVWDVYYEELEDYNNQLQTLSQSQSKTLLAAAILICIMVSASYASTIWKWRTQFEVFALSGTGVMLVFVGLSVEETYMGVTEAGEGEDARIKSAVCTGTLLQDGLGDTSGFPSQN